MNVVTPPREAYALSTSEPVSDTLDSLKDVTIACVDDDDAVRQSMSLFLRSFAYTVESFASAGAFLADRRPGARYCLVLDVTMPEMSGLELQRRLSDLGERLPIIFISAMDDATTRRTALEGGALGFLAKPPDHEELLRLLDIAVGEAWRDE